MHAPLEPEQQQRVDALARECGKTPEEMLRELVDQALDSRKRNGREPANVGENCYDLAKRIGFVGAVSKGPADRSTDAKHFEGFGRD